MAQFSEQKIDEQYKKLPPILQKAMFSIELAGEVYDIGRKHLLTIEEIGLLSEEIGYIFLGLVQPKEFSKNLTDKLHLDTEDLEKVVKEVNERVLVPVRELLKTAHNMDVEPTSPSVVPSAQQSAVPLSQKLQERELVGRSSPIDLRALKTEPKPVQTPSPSVSQNTEPLRPVTHPEQKPQTPEPKPIDLRPKLEQGSSVPSASSTPRVPQPPSTTPKPPEEKAAETPVTPPFATSAPTKPYVALEKDPYREHPETTEKDVKSMFPHVSPPPRIGQVPNQSVPPQPPTPPKKEFTPSIPNPSLKVPPIDLRNSKSAAQTFQKNDPYREPAD